MIVKTVLINGIRAIRYTYGTGSFKFTTELLSEVGKPWQAEARRKLAEKYPNARHGVDIDCKPWCVDMPK